MSSVIIKASSTIGVGMDVQVTTDNKNQLNYKSPDKSKVSDVGLTVRWVRDNCGMVKDGRFLIIYPSSRILDKIETYWNLPKQEIVEIDHQRLCFGETRDYKVSVLHGLRLIRDYLEDKKPRIKKLTLTTDHDETIVDLKTRGDDGEPYILYINGAELLRTNLINETNLVESIIRNLQLFMRAHKRPELVITKDENDFIFSRGSLKIHGEKWCNLPTPVGQRIINHINTLQTYLVRWGV